MAKAKLRGGALLAHSLKEKACFHFSRGVLQPSTRRVHGMPNASHKYSP